MVILCIYKLGIYIEVRVRILEFYDFGGGVTDIKLIYQKCINNTLNKQHFINGGESLFLRDFIMGVMRLFILVE